MKAFRHSRESAPRFLRASLCLFLALLFLYNPFIAAPSGGLSFHVDRSKSNRATVGASELQHFIAKERLAFAPQAEAIEDQPLFGSVHVFESLVSPPEVIQSPQKFWTGNLWFRPPPSA